jgi:hypothetical protein
MRISVRHENGELLASIDQSDDLTSFSVVVSPDVTVGEGLATTDGAVTFVSAERAWVDEGWLRRTGDFGAEGSSTAEGYDAMIDYAAAHGWIDPASGAVAAHVERVR